MLRFSIMATSAITGRSFCVAACNYPDLAQYIADHAVEALDPEGKTRLSIEVKENPAQNLFRKPKREVIEYAGL